MDEYFKEKGVSAKLLTYYFSNSMIEDRSEPEIKNRGFAIQFGDEFDKVLGGKNGQTMIAVATKQKMDFANENPLEGYRTYVADNENHTAMTWGDLIDGLNKRFEQLESQSRIDTEIFKKK